MRNTIVLFCIIMHIHADAMKRLCTATDTRPTKKLRKLPKNPHLPDDILRLIFKACAYNTNHHHQDKLRNIVITMKDFGSVNKKWYSYYNDKVVFNELLDSIYKATYCSHESIVKFLCPPVARQQIKAQRDLKELIITETFVLEPFNELTETITESLQNGARLDFTYNYRLESYTPLMMAGSNKVFKFLLSSGSNINETISNGTTLLMRATQFPISGRHVKRIVKNEALTIDQTNDRGETALLRCIRNRENYGISEVFHATVKKLLKYGADPLHADKNGWTPLLRAKELKKGPEYRKNQVIRLLNDAIDEKNKLLPVDFS